MHTGKTKGNVDILLISETRIDKSFFDSQFKIDGFNNSYRANRKKEAELYQPCPQTNFLKNTFFLFFMFLLQLEYCYLGKIYQLKFSVDKSKESCYVEEVLLGA